MIKTLTAYTFEIDDAHIAVAEILKQLNIEKELLKNSVGILTCYPEFIETGVVKALCDSLPFNVIGGTTIGNAVNGHCGRLMLAISVLTSNDVSFSGVVSEPLNTSSLKPALERACQSAQSKLTQKPSMAFVFAPILFNVSGDDIVSALDQVLEGLPLFGTMVADQTVDFSESQTIYNGISSQESLSLVLVAGDVEPKFSVNSLSGDKILRQQAIATAAEGNVLKQINGMSVMAYFKSIGLAPKGVWEDATAIALVIDYNDGATPVARGIYSLDDNGAAICGGVIPENSTVAVGAIDYEDVLRTAEKSIKEAVSLEQHNGILIFSCIARTLSLGPNVLAEMDMVNNILVSKIPYLLSYSGGEICPVYNEEGRAVNRFHNFTIVTCQF